MLKKQQLYLQLKQDIQQGIWPAGIQLTQQQLAEHYAVSRIPVRDVMQQLQAEAWLIPYGKAGLMVPPLTAVEAEELYQIRLQLEPMALQLAVPHLNFSQLGQAEDLLMQITRRPDASLFERGELNWQFHLLLYQPCQRPHLLRMLTGLHQQVARYLGFQEQAMDYSDISHQEHWQLIELLRQNKPDAAAELLYQHIAKAGELLVQHLQLHPA
ncbi:GntR family transcriptional regulator [Chromatiaceae bacterium AAb-1]|nr:GntR family transcriptional regulator [Chromatiaceae bacterium AAb-1]